MKNLKFLALFLFAFTACEDFEIDLPINDDLSNTAWQLTSFVIEDESGAKETIQDMDACEVDNILIFKESSFEYDEGATKCDEDDPQIQEGGIFVLSENQENLILTLEDEVIAAKVLEFNSETLKLEVDESENPNEQSICIMTFALANR